MNPYSNFPPRGVAPDMTAFSDADTSPRSAWGRAWHGWLLLTGPGDDVPQATVQERARLGRARATSTVIAGLLILAILVLPLGLQDPSHATLFADVVLFISILISAALNRLGLSTGAGAVLVAVLLFAITGAVAGASALDFIYLPAFDLLVIPVVVAASVLPLRFLWLVAVAAIGLTGADMIYQPRSTTAVSLNTFVTSNGIYSLMSRPIALIAVVCLLVFLQSVLLQRQVHRADRAEEVSELEARQLAQRRALESGVKQLLDVHVRLANGDYGARAALREDNDLFVVGRSLNNLVDRLQKAGEWEYQYNRMREEIERLALALDDARAGRRPFWPAPTQTPVDMLIARIVPQNRAALPPNRRTPEQLAPSAQPWNSGYTLGQTASQSAANPFSGFLQTPAGPDGAGWPPTTGNLPPRQPSPFSNSDGTNAGSDNPNPWFIPE